MRHSPKFSPRIRSLPARVCAYILVGVLALPLGSQSPPQEKPKPGKTTEEASRALRVTTRLVQISVIAQRGDGKPVSDLTKDDFAVFDRGQRQPIATFSMETTRTLVAASAARTVPPNFYSNRLEEKPGVPTAVTVILLDGLNTQFTDMAYAREQTIKFLSQLQPQDRVALYSLTNRLTVLHDFTSDATSLLAALKRYRTRDSEQVQASKPEVADTGGDEVDRFVFLNQEFQRMADFYITDRLLTTAAALEAIAKHVKRLPGRKNLIWVSGSFPFCIGMDNLTIGSTRQTRCFDPEIERAARALNDANLAIYPVDARGLMPFIFSSQPFSPAVSARGKAPQPLMTNPSLGSFDTMKVLAERTGGRAFYNTNDIFGSIRQAIGDSEVTYVLGYYPMHGEWNGKWHELKVQAKRPGVHLRFRRGYFALADKPHTPEEAKAVLAQAASSPLDFTTLGINARVDGVDVPGARSVKTEVLVEARNIQFEEHGNRWVGEFDVSYIQRSSDGKQVAGETQKVNMHLTRETYARALQTGLVMNQNVNVAPGAAQLRIIAQDVNSGSIGSVTIPLDKLFSTAK